MSSSTPAIPRSLFALSVFYGGMVVLAGLLGNKQIALGPLAVEAGIFAFLLLVIVSSAITELHGEKVATKLVRFGFVPMVVAMLLSWTVWAIPPAPKMDPVYRDSIQLILGATPRIWFAGIVAYGVSQTLNVAIFARMKAKAGGGRLVWLRGAIAGMVSQAIDTLLFVTIAFIGVFPIADLLIGQMISKVVLSAVAVPLLINAFVVLGRNLDAKESGQ